MSGISEKGFDCFGPADWDDIRLVVFDVDGTLYRQRPLRIRMTLEMLFYTLRTRDLSVVRVLSKYRRLREQLADARVANFEDVLTDAIAQAETSPVEKIRQVVSEWMEKRPLPYLAACVYPGLIELFSGLRDKQKTIGILSDYPAQAKLLAMGLTADRIVCANDASVGILKPHPRGLQHLISSAGVEPRQTLMIGDRPERDGIAAREAGTRVLIRSSKPIAGWQTFKRFDDALFASLRS